MPDEVEFIERLRQELPRLLREHPEVRQELWGMMLEAFPSRQEFMALLEEVRAFREDSNRRLEAIDRRFEAVIAELHLQGEELRRMGEELRRHGRQLDEMMVHLSSLGARVGRGLEDAVRGVVEEFAGQAFPFAERLVLQDETGEVFGVAGAEVEFDLYAHDGLTYLVEVKSHLKAGEVLTFYRKVKFAEGRLGQQVIPLMIAMSMEPRAEQQLRALGVKYRVRAVMG